MKIKSISVKSFKRFTELVVDEIPETARLVVVTGANGSGKSALLEAINYSRRRTFSGESNDGTYFDKVGDDVPSGWHARKVDIEFHGRTLSHEELREAIWVRSAFRHQADFSSTGVQRMIAPFENPGSEKLIATEQLAQENFSRLTSASVEALYNPQNREMTAGEITQLIVGPLQNAMSYVFDDLRLDNLTDPLDQGTFYFSKGSSSGFAFKNLSAGERAAFDLLLDLSVRARVFNDAVYCIDEPELHLGYRVQARLLEALLNLLPDNCQLWIATHSPGMMKTALHIFEAQQGEVCFLDTFGHDFDAPAHMAPVQPTAEFWRRSLAVALDDIAELVAPETLVLCEGAKVDGFDATCYRVIFGSSMPAVQFVSVGNSIEVKRDSQGVSAAVQVIAPGTRVVPLIDRDDATEDEVAALKASGTRVLSRRNIEAYLLGDEVIVALYNKNGRTVSDARAAIAKRDEELAGAIARGAAVPDDLKKVGSAMRAYFRNSLGLTQSGSDLGAFYANVLAPLIIPGTETYAALRSDIFDKG